MRNLLLIALFSMAAVACGVETKSQDTRVTTAFAEATQPPTKVTFTCDLSRPEVGGPRSEFPLVVAIDGSNSIVETADGLKLHANVLSGMHAHGTQLSGFSNYVIQTDSMRAVVIKLDLTFDNDTRAFGWSWVNKTTGDEEAGVDCKADLGAS